MPIATLGLLVNLTQNIATNTNCLCFVQVGKVTGSFGAVRV